MKVIYIGSTGGEHSGKVTYLGSSRGEHSHSCLVGKNGGEAKKKEKRKFQNFKKNGKNGDLNLWSCD